MAKPQYQYTPTADPNWVIRCTYNPVSRNYDVDCHRIPASDVPMGAVAKKRGPKGKRKRAKAKSPK